MLPKNDSLNFVQPFKYDQNSQSRAFNNQILEWYFTRAKNGYYTKICTQTLLVEELNFFLNKFILPKYHGCKTRTVAIKTRNVNASQTLNWLLNALKTRIYTHST